MGMGHWPRHRSAPTDRWASAIPKTTVRSVTRWESLPIRSIFALISLLVITLMVSYGPAQAAIGKRSSSVAGATRTLCPASDVPGGPTGCYLVPPGIHKIKHVIMIMQENRSFDSYFGTYPGADGLPAQNASSKICVPDSQTESCVSPYHDTYDVNGGGPHGEPYAIADVNHGAMNGFVDSAIAAKPICAASQDPTCTGGAAAHAPATDVMGYHTAAEIPNYWSYAKNFVLQDHMFESVKSWSLPDHLFMVSGWSAKCKSKAPKSCRNSIMGPYSIQRFDQAVNQELTTGTTDINLAWTDLTWLLFRHHVTWAYYVQTGSQPDCENDSAETCAAVAQSYKTPGIWNPLPLFTDVQADRQRKNIQPLDNFYDHAKSGTLPAVSWIVPSQADSDHPPASIHQGQAYVTSLINSVMKSPDWNSSAIFLSWDDWGGFYDNVVPPAIDQNGYGLRVPALVISPYAKKGYIDHQVLSSDAYLKFIEDDFLGGARLNPRTDGRPDPRPDVREDAQQLGNVANDFIFNQAPRPPLMLPTNPPSDSPELPGFFRNSPQCVGCTAPPQAG